ncbi:MAG TPA: fluoride efflux transporter CrcB [Leucothrix mucor]|uniref:Fluoride-specific ion channel FluC n=1 Tax=Leucothrix mucor TaxID=45248 RepID=A0A7V2T2A0_LEUMU|nr:fluoride efflux transporter CrcB [Leucothrix mucor]
MLQSILQIIVIMIGGALGAAMRYLVSSGFYSLLGRDFPYGTLAVNVIGSFFMGVLTVLLIDRVEVDPLIKLAILVGFLGSFTTFSTFSMDTLVLINEGALSRAFLNMLTNVVVCVSAVWLGMVITK